MSCLGSEIGFISDFAGTVLHSEEYGYLLTELRVYINVCTIHNNSLCYLIKGVLSAVD